LLASKPYKQPYKNIDIYLGQLHFIRMEMQPDFKWDSDKDQLNQKKLGVSFALAQLAFLNHHRVILEDMERGGDEKRYCCLGRVAGGIMTARFTYRNTTIRIIGAGYWRKGKRIDEYAAHQF
jgi:hypothetical protein